MKIAGQYVDLFRREIYPATVEIRGGTIAKITKHTDPLQGPFIMPGFVDAHVHIESSMLVPSRFAELAIAHGTVATVSDPHEIANVLGKKGVEFMLSDAAKVPLKMHFGVPSCVPATPFETSGATLDAKEVNELLQRPNLYYLAEMMNYPGVLFEDTEVMAKIASAHANSKPIDGHAPGLTGKELEKYAKAGISTDHEAFTLAEAREKVNQGMKIQIREGSAAKNYHALAPIIQESPDSVMFCMDDCHPDDLLKGHINSLVKRALEDGYNFFDVLRAASVHAIEHYNLPVGLLREGDPADFIVVGDLKEFNLKQVFIDGKLCYDSTGFHWIRPETEPVNQFVKYPLTHDDFAIPAKTEKVKVIQVEDGELITSTKIMKPNRKEGYYLPDTHQDLLKIAVVNRYKKAPVQVGFITGFGLKEGAFASSIAHDSHNVIVVGTSDQEMKRAVEILMDSRGGVAVVNGQKQHHLALPVAGLMSLLTGEEVAASYQELDKQAKRLGCDLKAPFMSLAFMALLVIPELKIGDKGLFDGKKFQFTDLYVRTKTEID